MGGKEELNSKLQIPERRLFQSKSRVCCRLFDIQTRLPPSAPPKNKIKKTSLIHFGSRKTIEPAGVTGELALHHRLQLASSAETQLTNASGAAPGPSSSSSASGEELSRVPSSSRGHSSTQRPPPAPPWPSVA